MQLVPVEPPSTDDENEKTRTDLVREQGEDRDKEEEEKQEEILINTKNVTEWTGEEIIKWITSLEGGRYAHYENDLKDAFVKQEIDGKCLCDVKEFDLLSWNVIKFKDRVGLFKKIEQLVSKKEEGQIKLMDDIWSLSYVVFVQNKGKISRNHSILLLCIYLIQVTSLIMLILGYLTMLNKNVVIKYKMCEGWNEGWEAVECQWHNVELIEENAATQKYEDTKEYGYSMNFNFFDEFPWIFCFSGICSWLLLSAYVFSSFTNAVIMMIIADETINVKQYKYGIFNCFCEWEKFCCCKCNKSCLLNVCCCKCNKSWFLYGMAWANILLSIASYCTGLVVIVSYPVYFGITSPVDIVLTPIGIVFILEIDNWLFVFMKHCFFEGQNEELWSMKPSYFKKEFINLYERHWLSLRWLYIVVSFVCMCIVWIYSVMNSTGTLFTKTGKTYQYSIMAFSLVGSAWTLAELYKCKIMPKSNFRK